MAGFEPRSSCESTGVKHLYIYKAWNHDGFCGRDWDAKPVCYDYSRVSWPRLGRETRASRLFTGFVASIGTRNPYVVIFTGFVASIGTRNPSDTIFMGFVASIGTRHPFVTIIHGFRGPDSDAKPVRNYLHGFHGRPNCDAKPVRYNYSRVSWPGFSRETHRRYLVSLSFTRNDEAG